MSETPPETYDSRSVAFHWATALLVALQWAGGQTIDWFPRGPLRVDARSVHLTLGVLLVIIVAMRLVWRMTHAQRPRPVGPALIRAVAPLVHWLLYALVGAVLILGVATELVRGDNFFGLFRIPAFPAGRSLPDSLGELHELLANTLLIVAGVHALAALLHDWIWRGRVLRRMIPGLRPRGDHDGAA